MISKDKSVCKNFKYWDRYVRVNSADPDGSSLIWVYTFYYSSEFSGPLLQCRNNLFHFRDNDSKYFMCYNFLDFYWQITVNKTFFLFFFILNNMEVITL